MFATSFAAEKKARQFQIAKLRRPGGLGALRGDRTSRRKRGPVALRPSLLTGLPLSHLQLCAIYSQRQFWDVLNVRYGSLADILAHFPRTAAFGWLAEIGPS